MQGWLQKVHLLLVVSPGLRPPKEVHHQRNYRYYDQKVNEPAGNVEREKPQQPQ
jgi:hypothetical protein